MPRKSYAKGEWQHRWDTDAEPGTWVPKKMDGVDSALLCCPECGWVAGIRSHTIEENGEVNPSIVCDNGACTFHEFIVLEGWRKEK